MFEELLDRPVGGFLRGRSDAASVPFVEQHRHRPSFTRAGPFFVEKHGEGGLEIDEIAGKRGKVAFWQGGFRQEQQPVAGLHVLAQAGSECLGGSTDQFPGVVDELDLTLPPTVAELKSESHDPFAGRRGVGYVAMLQLLAMMVQLSVADMEWMCRAIERVPVGWQRTFRHACYPRT